MVSFWLEIKFIFCMFLGTVIITIYGLPWLVLILAPLIPVYHWLQNLYRLTSRELKRLSSVTLSPVYSHFSETLLGLPTIRSFRATPRSVDSSKLLCSVRYMRNLTFISFYPLKYSVWRQLIYKTLSMCQNMLPAPQSILLQLSVHIVFSVQTLCPVILLTVLSVMAYTCT